MNNSLKNISPSHINDAIFNIAIRHEVVKKQPLNETFYIDSSKSFSCIEYIKSMRNLATSIEFGSGHATWQEYHKLLSLFIEGLAKTKGMSIEAAQEIVATEVKAIQTLIDINRVKAAAQKKESEQFFKATLYLVAGIAAFFIVYVMLNSIKETVNQRFLNNQELELLRNENQQLRQENETLKSDMDKFQQFQQERNKLENLKAENEALRQKNSNLNDRLIQCKKPFWERKCN